ncbi:hypothetical protein DM828_03985 [Pseudomonas umsongensis]|nr:hypothetical protein [Pseudomonas umsongensis]
MTGRSGKGAAHIHCRSPACRRRRPDPCHEVVGRIVRAGSQVRGLEVGQRVGIGVSHEPGQCGHRSLAQWQGALPRGARRQQMTPGASGPADAPGATSGTDHSRT